MASTSDGKDHAGAAVMLLECERGEYRYKDDMILISSVLIA